MMRLVLAVYDLIQDNFIIHLLYIQICGREYLYISPELNKPCPKLHFSKYTPPDTNIKIAYKTNLVYSLTETQGFEEWLTNN